jgi:hypothetical protein
MFRTGQIALVVAIAAAVTALGVGMSAAPASASTATASSAIATSRTYVEWWHGCKWYWNGSRWFKLGCNYRLQNGLWYFDRYRNTWYSYPQHRYWAQNRQRIWFTWNGKQWVLPSRRRVTNANSLFMQQQFRTYYCQQLNMLGAMFGGGIVNPFMHCG